MSRQHAHRMSDRFSESSPSQRNEYRRYSSPALERMSSDSHRWSTGRSERIDYENRLQRSSLLEPKDYCRESIGNRRSNPSFLCKDRPFHSNSPFSYREQPGSDHNQCSRSPFGEPSSWFHERQKSPSDHSYPPSDYRYQESQRKSHNHLQIGSRSSLSSNCTHSGIKSSPYYGGHSPGYTYARSRSPHLCNGRARSRSPFDSWSQHFECPGSSSSGLLTHGRRLSLHDEVPRRRSASIRDRTPSPFFEKRRQMTKPYTEPNSDCASCGHSKLSQYDKLGTSLRRSPPSVRSDFDDRDFQDLPTDSHYVQRQRVTETGASLPRCRSRELLDR